MTVKRLTLHGHRIAYRHEGEGPAVLLVHGMAGSSETWSGLIPRLARDATVIAPDLLGHGGSSKPSGDYSLGSLATQLRDVLVALGCESATIVGHSLGGGIAMQFAYQFPERCERLVLVSAGGLGRDVHTLLRALSIPGAEYLLSLGCTPRLRSAGDTLFTLFGKFGLSPAPTLAEFWRSYISLGDREGRAAFMRTLRSVIDASGQRVSAMDRLYLAEGMPTMIVWGARDAIIPVSHAHEAHAAIAGSTLHVYDDAGHHPHQDHPDRFAADLLGFITETEPARLVPASLRERLLRLERALDDADGPSARAD